MLKYLEKIGFVSMFFIFSTILYFILKLTNKIPIGWNYLHILIITLLPVLIGTLIKILLQQENNGNNTKDFKKGVKQFGETISILINTIILTFVYFIGIGLTSIFAKILGKKFLNISNSHKNTYWSELNLNKKPIEEYYRQF